MAAEAVAAKTELVGMMMMVTAAVVVAITAIVMVSW